MKILKIALLHILSVILSVCPVLVYFFANIDKYTKTVPETVKLCAGGILFFIIVIFKVLGKLKIPSGIILYGVIFILSYLFDAIIEDLIIFSFLALIGELLSEICDAVTKYQKQKLEREKTASMTAETVKKIIGASGRV